MILKKLCSELINHVSDKSIRQINNFQIDKLILMSDTVIHVENLGKKYKNILLCYCPSKAGTLHRTARCHY
jgi:hypothetical protein